MGLQVNQTSVQNLYALNATSVSRTNSQQGTGDNSAQIGSEQSTPEASGRPFQRNEKPPDRVGFGKGSVSVPTAAVRTIDRNLEAAARVVPSLEETRQRIRERLAKVQDELDTTRTEPAPPQRLDISVGRIDAADNARTLLNNLNDTIGTTAARLQGETPPQSGPRIDIRVGDQTLPLLRQTQSPTFDFFA